MTEETIVAVYDSASHADAAVRDLEEIGIPHAAIGRHAGAVTTEHAGTAEPVREKGFWSSLLGGDAGRDEQVYDRSMTEGSSVVTVKVAEHDVQHVSDVLERHSPIDMDERASAYGVSNGGGTTAETTTATGASGASAASGMSAATGTTGAMAKPAAGVTSTGGDEVLALSEEQLSIGKRLVNRGTTRIRRFSVETPVEENVTLRSEEVSIERRPVAADAKVADNAFADRTVEVTESAEEAVVGKSVHVKEEVVVNKAATERVETVHGTVRHEDVEITRDEPAGTSAATERTDPAAPRSAV